MKNARTKFAQLGTAKPNLTFKYSQAQRPVIALVTFKAFAFSKSVLSAQRKAVASCPRTERSVSSRRTILVTHERSSYLRSLFGIGIARLVERGRLLVDGARAALAAAQAVPEVIEQPVAMLHVAVDVEKDGKHEEHRDCDAEDERPRGRIRDEARGGAVPCCGQQTKRATQLLGLATAL